MMPMMMLAVMISTIPMMAAITMMLVIMISTVAMMMPLAMTSTMPTMAATPLNADAERDLPWLHLAEKHSKSNLLMEGRPLAHPLHLLAICSRTHRLDSADHAHHDTSHRSLHALRAHWHCFIRRALSNCLLIVVASFCSLLFAMLRRPRLVGGKSWRLELVHLFSQETQVHRIKAAQQQLFAGHGRVSELQHRVQRFGGVVTGAAPSAK